MPLLEGGWGWHCVRCSTFVTSDDLFAAVGTTAFKALQALEAQWEEQARIDETAEAMEKANV